MKSLYLKNIFRTGILFLLAETVYAQEIPSREVAFSTKAEADLRHYPIHQIQLGDRTSQLAATTGSVESGADRVEFDPFGKGISYPRRVKANRQIWLEATNINPFKYNVQLTVNAVSYKYEIPNFPKEGALAPKAPTDPSPDKSNLVPSDRANMPALLSSFETIQDDLNRYDGLAEELRRLYRRDAWVAASESNKIDGLIQEGKDLLGSKPLTANNFAEFKANNLLLLQALVTEREIRIAGAADTVALKKRLETSTRETDRKKWAGQLKTKRKALKAETDTLHAMQRLNTQLMAQLGINALGADAGGKDLIAKEHLVLGQVLVALSEGVESISRVPVKTGGDEMDVKLTLTKRDDYVEPPGRAPGKLLDWQTTIMVTHRFRVTASAGPFITGLRDFNYGLLGDSSKVRRRVISSTEADTATTVGYQSNKRIVRLNSEEKVNLGIAGLTHFHFRLNPSVDLAASLGLGAQTTGLQVMTGLTVLTGGEKQRLGITGGLVGGRVTRLSGGYKVDQHVSQAIDVVPTQTINKASWFVAVTYNLTATRE